MCILQPLSSTTPEVSPEGEWLPEIAVYDSAFIPEAPKRDNAQESLEDRFLSRVLRQI
ncbi:MAG: hypothetical protein LBU32_32270 [Clostridiales bacterium]|jgi:hypothetical protein|nr:hypothetical protein [Clostridiales bacterium]